MNRDALSRRLVRSGYEVVTAVNGEEGVQLANSEKPDLILMDMGLPIMDGWAATAALKGQPDTQTYSYYCPDSPCHDRGSREGFGRWRRRL